MKEVVGMGQGLHFGIMTEFEVIGEKCSFEVVEKEVNKEFPDMFDVREDQKGRFSCGIKSEVLGEHYQNFLTEQFTLMGDLKDKQYYIDALDGLTGDEILEKVKSGDIFANTFTFWGEGYRFPHWENRPTIHGNGISYESFFKVFMECGENALCNMLIKLMAKNSKNPLGKLFFVTIE